MADGFKGRVKTAWHALVGKGTPSRNSGTEGELAFADPLRLFTQDMFTPYNPSALVTRQGLKVFDQMKLDDQIKAALTFKKQAVLSSGWTVTSPETQEKNWEVTLFVEWVLENLQGTLEETLIGVLSFLDYGYSVSEIVYVPIEEGPYSNQIGIRAIKDRKPHSFDFKVDVHGNLDELIQIQITERVSLPPDKFVLYTHEKEFGNWYGRSDLEAAYRPWWSKTNTYQWFVMYLERMGIPPMFALYDPIAYNTQQKNDLKTVMTTMQSATSGILPRPSRPEADPKDVLDFWTPELSKQARQVFVPALDMFNRDIARAILMPGLLGFTPDSSEGSLARSKKHFDVFIMVVEYLRKRIERRVMFEQVIKPLVDLNFSTVEEYPIFKFNPITDEVRSDLLERWMQAVEKGVVTPQKQDEAHVRDQLKFPEKDESEEANMPIRGEDLDKEEKEEEKQEGKEKEKEEAEEEKQDKEKEFEEFKVKEVNFKQIKRTLDMIEKQTLSNLRELLSKSRDALLVFVQRNFDSLPRMVHDLRLKGMSEIQSAIKEFLRETYREGESSMRGELPTSRDFGDAPQFRPTEALKWLNSKGILISGVLRDRVLSDAKLAIMSGLEKGESIRQIQARLKEVFEPYVGDTTVVVDQEQLKAYRLETIIRTNTTAAYNQGRLVEARQVENFLHGMRYSAILDERTTEVCRLLDGKIFKMDDPSLDELRPPRHFNCRSILVAVPLGIEVEKSNFLTSAEAGEGLGLSGEGFSE